MFQAKTAQPPYKKLACTPMITPHALGELAGRHHVRHLESMMPHQ